MSIEQRAATVSLDDVSFAYRDSAGTLPVLGGLTLSVKSGEIVSLIGPSGCGKSTILKIVAGLLEPDGGSVSIEGEGSARRIGRCGYIPQGYSLFPWLTVRRNIEFGMQLNNLPASRIREASSKLLEVTGLREFADAYPKTLSGGMKQRVAIARALAIDPDVVLMDEPFAALDLQTRFEVQRYLLEILQRTSKSVLLVTHDLEEAIILSDRILILSGRPSFIRNEIHVKLARPRSRDVRFSDELIAMYGAIAREVLSGLVI